MRVFSILFYSLLFIFIGCTSTQLAPIANKKTTIQQKTDNLKEYNNHIDIIQTDRPELLLKYLPSKGLHD